MRPRPPPQHGGLRRPHLRHRRAGQPAPLRGDLGQGQNHQSSCRRLDVLAARGHSHQCFCLPATTSKTRERVFRFLHLPVLHFCRHTYLLVSTRRPGT